MKLVSVVVPCYNEQEVLPMFYDEITKTTDGMSEQYPELEFEYVFINDGSKDKTLEILRSLADKDKRVRYISFSRNFGKESGMYAGLQNAKGDYIVVMPIFSIRRHFCRRCTAMSVTANMTAPPHVV